MAPIALYTPLSTCPKVQVENLLATGGELLIVIEDLLMFFPSNYALRKLLEFRSWYQPGTAEHRRLTEAALQIYREELKHTSIVESLVEAALEVDTDLLDSPDVKVLCSASPIQYDRVAGEEASTSSEPTDG